METAVFLLRNLHISAGAVALAVFCVPLVVKKGNSIHRRAGWVYVVAMFVAALTAVLIAPLRMMQRPVDQWGPPIFLAYVALLSFTSCFFGVRVLRQKRRTAPHTEVLDLAVPSTLLVATALICVYGALSGMKLMLAFAPVGVLVFQRQWRKMRGLPDSKAWWLIEHLTSMLAAVIGTLTAFFVVNAGRFTDSAPYILVWLAPTLVGVPLIAFWRRRYQNGVT